MPGGATARMLSASASASVDDVRVLLDSSPDHRQPSPQMRFVDVFGDAPFTGNALAVVHDADQHTEAEMAATARWTNLSETVFLCAPTAPGADYRVRIFTTSTELPFAGHPTLGAAHAWLEAGGRPRRDDQVVQQCGAGLVVVRRGERLAFEAPPLVRSGPVDPEYCARLTDALGLDPSDVVAAAWVDNGPGWVALLLGDADAVLALQPQFSGLAGLNVGVVGRWADGAHPDSAAVEVRAFCGAEHGAVEDPVTGSLNAGLAQWLVPAGVLPRRYVAAQGTSVGRGGRVHVEVGDDGTVLVGGDTRTVVAGALTR
ncbi:MAG: PhzF family phenazine biosynthesis protein [Dermatophilaceae bacterium]